MLVLELWRRSARLWLVYRLQYGVVVGEADEVAIMPKRFATDLMNGISDKRAHGWVDGYLHGHLNC